MIIGRINIIFKSLLGLINIELIGIFNQILIEKNVSALGYC